MIDILGGKTRTVGQSRLRAEVMFGPFSMPACSVGKELCLCPCWDVRGRFVASRLSASLSHIPYSVLPNHIFPPKRISSPKLSSPSPNPTTSCRAGVCVPLSSASQIQDRLTPRPGDETTGLIASPHRVSIGRLKTSIRSIPSRRPTELLRPPTSPAYVARFSTLMGQSCAANRSTASYSSAPRRCERREHGFHSIRSGVGPLLGTQTP